jgi:YYY domain-containing protein
VIDVIAWLLAAELVGLAAFPFVSRLFGSYPDRGFGLAKIGGMLAFGWILLVTGSILPVANSVPLAWILVLGVLVCGWAAWGKGLITWMATNRRILAIEESLFITGYVGWTLVRALNPEITGTEKPMDLMLLQAVAKSASFPPQDFWFSGHSLNYYYFGYVPMSLLSHLATVSPFVGFNLGIATVMALAIVGSFSLGLALTGSMRAAGFFPALLVLLGNAHAFFLQVVEGEFPWNGHYYWFWPSSRVVPYTVNEFPIFSLTLGDLHAHLLDIPFALLSLGVAFTLLATAKERLANRLGRLVIAGAITGATWATNSWDFPTYSGIALVLVVISRVRHDWADRTPGSSIRASIRDCAFLAIGVLLWLPFIASFHSPTHGLGLVTTRTPLPDFLQAFGLLLATCGVLLVLRARADMGRSVAHVSTLLIATTGVLVGVGAWFIARFDLGVAVITGGLALIAGGLLIRWMGRKDSEQEVSDGYVLTLLAACGLVLLVTETIYVKDGFAGSAYYRFNTVFKLYYQAWILLAIGAAFAFSRVRQLLNRASARAVWTVVVCGVVVVGGVYTVLGPISYYASPTGTGLAAGFHPLNGLAAFAAEDPPDFRAIMWMRTHIKGLPVELEATGPEYSLYGRVSVFAGLPTPLGWEGHELEWRGIYGPLQARVKDVDRAYATGRVAVAQGELRRLRVGIVYVGPCEEETFGGGGPAAVSCGGGGPVSSSPNALTKFATFLPRIYHRDGVSIYTTAQYRAR